MEKDVNQRVKLLRSFLNYTQNEFASKINCTLVTISRIENYTTTPRKSLLFEICRVFNVNKEWLFDGVGEMLLPGESFEKDHNTFDWKEEAYDSQKKYIQNLENQVEFLKSIVSKMVGTPNFHDGIASALGNILGNTVSAAA